MPFLYQCITCEKTTSHQGFLITTADLGQMTTCPFCGGLSRARFVREYKNRTGDVKMALSWDSAERSRDRQGRRGRGVRSFDDNFDRPDFNDLRVAYQPAQDQGAEDDSEYVPQVDFDPQMRLTKGQDAACRNPQQMAQLVYPLFEVPSPDHVITNRAGRTDTGTAMARHFSNWVKPLQKLSAFSWANWGGQQPTRGMSYKVNKFRSLEWCHLIADSLGGPTQADNLVAASYGANTHMMTIESELNARSTLTIKVVASCSRDHVAEYFTYTVKKGAKAWSVIIDARNDDFTAADYARVQNEVRAAIASL